MTPESPEPSQLGISPTTMDAQIACVRRELAFRQRVYPSMVKSGRMKQDEADAQLAAMQAVHDTLVAVRGMDSAPGGTPGMMVVPMEPTERMLKAGNKAGLDTFTLFDDARFSVERATYAAMLKAAP